MGPPSTRRTRRTTIRRTRSAPGVDGDGIYCFHSLLPTTTHATTTEDEGDDDDAS